jgi:hypothetical protein
LPSGTQGSWDIEERPADPPADPPAEERAEHTDDERDDPPGPRSVDRVVASTRSAAFVVPQIRPGGDRLDQVRRWGADVVW